PRGGAHRDDEGGAPAGGDAAGIDGDPVDRLVRAGGVDAVAAGHGVGHVVLVADGDRRTGRDDEALRHVGGVRVDHQLELACAAAAALATRATAAGLSAAATGPAGSAGPAGATRASGATSSARATRTAGSPAATATVVIVVTTARDAGDRQACRQKNQTES